MVLALLCVQRSGRDFRSRAIRKPPDLPPARIRDPGHPLSEVSAYPGLPLLANQLLGVLFLPRSENGTPTILQIESVFNIILARMVAFRALLRKAEAIHLIRANIFFKRFSYRGFLMSQIEGPKNNAPAAAPARSSILDSVKMPLVEKIDAIGDLNKDGMLSLREVTKLPPSQAASNFKFGVREWDTHGIGASLASGKLISEVDALKAIDRLLPSKIAAILDHMDPKDAALLAITKQLVQTGRLMPVLLACRHSRLPDATAAKILCASGPDQDKYMAELQKRDPAFAEKVKGWYDAVHRAWWEQKPAQENRPGQQKDTFQAPTEAAVAPARG